MEPIRIIDLFAGPGGLGEGFSSLTDKDGDNIFQIALSIERDEHAHATLRFRSFARKIFKNGKYPLLYRQFLVDPVDEKLKLLKEAYPDEWAEASAEALCATLVQGDKTLINLAKQRLADYSGPLVLIGGPPCQAYSLVGRSRRANDPTLQTDEKQTLYKCYLEFLEALQPDVFVMENVKGLLSAELGTSRVFDNIKNDMKHAGYEIRSLVCANPKKDSDYVVEAEKYGIPQARHRVILLGIKENASVNKSAMQLRPHAQHTVREAISDLPILKSRFSIKGQRIDDSTWSQYISNAAEELLETEEGKPLAAALEPIRNRRILPKRTEAKHYSTSSDASPLTGWYRGRLATSAALPNHETRSHLASDLDRYLFCAAYSEVFGEPARLWHMPANLLPNHKNALNAKNEANHNIVKFSDRFRVQMYDRPSTTVTSHISKDGHYFIHPDVRQCRALTVREAARLQTFPDDYFFMGNRTHKYHQVGNAVPPLLAQQIAKIVAARFNIEAETFFEKADC